MFLNLSDNRIPLNPGTVVEITPEKRFVIDRYLASGGFAMMYLAHQEGSNHYVALKELYPRNVENIITQRNEDGHIAIDEPFGGDDGTLSQELKSYFEREAALTRRAGTVYDRSGKEIKQNNLDILHVEGPMAASNGNLYLAIDTFAGESFRDLIERGFVRDEDGKCISNRYLAEIFDILLDTAIRLSSLHDQEHIYHLDLSPDNIYIAQAAGQTRRQPFIIDYGSAYDQNNQAESVEHRYTVNLHSAPEIQALSEFQTPDCGYIADESSDTYSLASILFYAVTGQIFTAKMRIFSDEWKEEIISEYSVGLSSHSGADSFTQKLVSFFEKGLAAAQYERYRSAKDLYNDLLEIKETYQQYGNLLPLIPSDELMSYMVFEKHPLYQYIGADNNIHVVCLGCGRFVRQMLPVLISTGQMADHHLNIHVVANEPEDSLWSYLHDAAPELPKYSNIDGPAEEDEYVTFTYDQVEDITDETTCIEILEKYPYTNYYLISLGKNRVNAEAASLCARILSERREKARDTIINYSCSDDLANTNYSINVASLPTWLTVDGFANELSSYSSTIRSLGYRTLRFAYLYDKLSDPRISLAESASRLSQDQYNQRNSCASTVHLKYKLASIGINPAPSTNIRYIISAYQKAINSEKKGILMELEHRRWMLYMIASLGYTRPSKRELLQYGFEMVDQTFNQAWKCKAKKIHPCIVPSSRGGVAISSDDWDIYTTEDAIQSSEFDQLDKVSLLLHLLSKEKCEDAIQDIQSCFRGQEIKLRYAQTELEGTIQYSSVKQLLDAVKEEVCDAVSRFQNPNCYDKIQVLKETLSDLGINVDEMERLTQLLSIFAEYSACKDYKAPDEIIINNLPWILYARNDITMIKLVGRTIADNISGPIILEPNNLIYFGTANNQDWITFLRNHGLTGRIEFIPHGGTTVAEIQYALSRLIEQCNKRCIIDVTGADEQMIIAAHQTTTTYKNISLIRSNSSGEIENLDNFVIAPIYSLNTALNASEIYALHGAHRNNSSDGGYMTRLDEWIPAMWQFYRDFQSSWNMITAFVAHKASNGAGLWCNRIAISDTTQWVKFSYDKVAWTHWESLKLTKAFEDLRDAGIIRELSIMHSAGRAVVSFQHPSMDFLSKAFYTLFNYKVPYAYSPFYCTIDLEEKGYSINIKSECLVDYNNSDLQFTDNRKGSNGQKYNIEDMKQPLQAMEDLGLISGLKCEIGVPNRKNTVSYMYSSTAIKKCFELAGSILELFVWYSAKQTRYFDDCDSNFSFSWASEGVSNELDVILTKGLSSLIISCKTSKFNKEHLYEIKYLTERFSVNSIPVIVYSSTMAYEDGHLTSNLSVVKNRAKAMGVHLIDLNALDCTSGEKMEEKLGQKLIRIISGQDTL